VPDREIENGKLKIENEEQAPTSAHAFFNFQFSILNSPTKEAQRAQH
jgi:hypothetical protein